MFSHFQFSVQMKGPLLDELVLLSKTQIQMSLVSLAWSILIMFRNLSVGENSRDRATHDQKRVRYVRQVNV